jgi:hypothetical protein
MIAGKQKLSDQVLQAGAETALTELSDVTFQPRSDRRARG